MAYGKTEQVKNSYNTLIRNVGCPDSSARSGIAVWGPRFQRRGCGVVLRQIRDCGEGAKIRDCPARQCGPATKM